MSELIGFLLGYGAFALVYARRKHAALALLLLSWWCWDDTIATLLTLMAAGSAHIVIMPLLGRRR